jgi:hypothetical protein
VPVPGRVAGRNEIVFRPLRKKRNDLPPTLRVAERHRSRTVPEPHGSFRVLFSPLWVTLAVTKRTLAGENQAFPDRRVTTMRVGRELRSVTVRWPVERRTTVHPSSVDSTDVFQYFVIVARIVTSNAARVGRAASAAPARIARTQTRAMPQEAFMAATPCMVPSGSGKFQVIRFVE